MGNATKAYRTAYPGNGSNATASREAVILRQDPRIHAEIERIRDDSRVQNAIELAELVESSRGMIASLQAGALRPRVDAEGKPVYIKDSDGAPVLDATGQPIQDFEEHMTTEVAREIRGHTELLAKLGGFLDKSRFALPDGTQFVFEMNYGGDKMKIETDNKEPKQIQTDENGAGDGKVEDVVLSVPDTVVGGGSEVGG